MKKRQEPFLSFKKVLGFYPRRIELYELAVRHRSKPLRNADGKWENNERLEFLGDAVLNSIVADQLYRTYGKAKEGFLTNARSNIVKRDTLNKICRQIGLDKLIVADSLMDLSAMPNLYGNALEALVGAVYLDVGYEKCADFVRKKILISPEWMQTLVEENENYKSELLEWCQQRQLNLEYELLEETVDAKNNHTFTSQVLISGKAVCTGVGSSKKESHQQASLRALEMIKEGWQNSY